MYSVIARDRELAVPRFGAHEMPLVRLDLAAVCGAVQEKVISKQYS